MKVSILVPVYNEEKTLIHVINKLKNLLLEDKEIIVIDDGSTDNTKKILLNISGNDIKTVFHKKNLGKGKAIQTGLLVCSGDIVVIQDADLEYEPEEITKLIDVFDNRPEISAVYGSRFLKENPNIYKRYLWGNKFLTGLINFLYKSNFTDTYTCYKAVRRQVLVNLGLESKRFEIEAEISCKLAKDKYKIAEIPINYNPRTLDEGKKINFKDAIKGILTIIKNL